MVMTTGTQDDVFQTYATAARATAISSSRKPIMVQMMTKICTHIQYTQVIIVNKLKFILTKVTSHSLENALISFAVSVR